MDLVNVEPPGADIAVVRRDPVASVPPAPGTVVFLHGLGDAASMFGPALESPALAPHRLALVDLLGHGLSDKPTHFDYAPASHAAVLSVLLRQLHLPAPVHLVGYSFGGAVAIELSRFLERDPGVLLLCEPAVDPARMDFARRVVAQTEGDFVDGFATMLQQYAGPESTEADRRWAETAAFAGSRAFYRCARGLLAAAERGELAEHLLEARRPKALVLDPQTHDRWPLARTLEEEGAQVFLIKSRSKMPMYEAPEPFYECVAQAIAAAANRVH